MPITTPIEIITSIGIYTGRTVKRGDQIFSTWLTPGDWHVDMHVQNLVVAINAAPRPVFLGDLDDSSSTMVRLSKVSNVVVFAAEDGDLRSGSWFVAARVA